MNYNNVARRVIQHEILALEELMKNMPKCFDEIISLIISAKGKLVLMGVGKSGYIAQKIASSLASTGTSAIFVHPTEASHGDLGLINQNDIVIMFSNSGNSHELLNSIYYCNKYNIMLIGITMNVNSMLGKKSNLLLKIPEMKEVSNIPAPTNSTIMMLSLGDALVTAVHEAKNFTESHYLKFHPGGQIGHDLTNISEIMHKKSEIPIVTQKDNFGKILIEILEHSSSYVVVVNESGQFSGIIDYKEIKESIINDNMQESVSKLLNKNVVTISINTRLSTAKDIMNKHLLNALVVVQDNNEVIGVLYKNDLDNKLSL